MPYPVKVQPIDEDLVLPRRKLDSPVVAKPVLLKARFKRLFERRNSVQDKPVEPLQRESSEEFEPSSICLARMVQNYIEENNNEKLQKCGRSRCNCFSRGGDSSDDDSSSADACILLKSLVPCSSVSERNLLADVSKMVERNNKVSKNKDGVCRKMVADGLVSLGYDASVCKSQWENSPLFPAGMYEYVDVITEGERLIIDIDFRSEFEIARSSKCYKQILQILPNIFVGKADRLESIIGIVSEAAKHSMKKKGMPFPPWRKEGYVKAKWLSPFTRIKPGSVVAVSPPKPTAKGSSGDGEFELLFGDDNSDNTDSVSSVSNTNSSPSEKSDGGGVVVAGAPLVKEWEPPEIRPKSLIKGVKLPKTNIMEGGGNNFLIGL